MFALGEFELRVQGRHGDLGADQTRLLRLQFGRGLLVDQALLRQGAVLFRAQAGDLGFQFAGFQRRFTGIDGHQNGVRLDVVAFGDADRGDPAGNAGRYGNQVAADAGVDFMDVGDAVVNFQAAEQGAEHTDDERDRKAAFARLQARGFFCEICGG